MVETAKGNNQAALTRGTEGAAQRQNRNSGSEKQTKGVGI